MQYVITEFADKIKETIMQRLPEDEKGCSVMLQDKMKNNDIMLHGIAIRPEGLSAVPLIYLENYYGDYLDGRPIEDISDEIIDVSMQLRENTPVFRLPEMDYGNIKDMLRVRILDTSSNSNMMEHLVNRDVGCGFSMTAYIDLQGTGSIEGIIHITREQARAFGYDELELLETALYNSALKDPPVLRRMNDMILGDEDTDLLAEEGRTENSILVLGHESVEYGSVALYYPGIRKKISEIVGGDYFVIPSSVHELLILPDNGMFDSHKLMEMVSSVNSSVLDPQDVLADRVLFYRSDLGRLTVAEDMSREKVKDLAR